MSTLSSVPGTSKVLAMPPGMPGPSLMVHQRRTAGVLGGLGGVLLGCSVVAVGHGMVTIAPGQVLAILAHQLHLQLPWTFTIQQEMILLAIRLPRVLLGMLIGAGLAVSGAAMQGLFRNPLAYIRLWRKVMQPEALYAVLQERRSINLQDMLPEAIEPQRIEQMLEAANWAPSHGHTEPWRFTVITGAARSRLGEVFAEAYRLATPAERFDAAAMAFTRERVLRVPVWISIGMEPDPVKQMPEWEEISAVAIAVHNMHLMACSLGLGCKWASGATSRHPLVAQFVGLRPPAQLLGFLFVGKPAKVWPTGRRRPIADKVTWL